MQRTPLVGGLLCLCVLFGGAGCTGQKDETEADLTEQISDSLQGSGAGYSAEQADCYAGIIVDEAGFEALKDLDLTADEPPEELQDEIASAALRATEECDLADIGG